MATWSGAWARELDRPVAVALVVLLMGVRFLGGTAIAFAGVQGIDTRGLDAAFGGYSDVLVVILILLVGLRLTSSGAAALRKWNLLAFVVATAVVVVFWLGAVEPRARILGGDLGAWSDFATGMAAALGFAAFAWVQIAQLRAGDAPRSALVGLHLLAFGFATAVLLRSIRLLDFPYLFGWQLPSGLLWALDYGPGLLLAAIAVTGWIRFAWRPKPGPETQTLLLGVPLAFAGAALSVALGGLGGFIASNALAWGGSYTVFAPTTVSLPIIGFGFGAFLSTSWVSGRRLPREAAWLLFGGVAIAALAGIQTSAGTLASFAGLLAGFVTSARGASACVPSNIE